MFHWTLFQVKEQVTSASLEPTFYISIILSAERERERESRKSILKYAAFAELFLQYCSFILYLCCFEPVDWSPELIFMRNVREKNLLMFIMSDRRKVSMWQQYNNFVTEIRHSNDVQCNSHIREMKEKKLTGKKGERKKVIRDLRTAQTSDRLWLCHIHYLTWAFNIWKVHAEENEESIWTNVHICIETKNISHNETNGWSVKPQQKQTSTSLVIHLERKKTNI